MYESREIQLNQHMLFAEAEEATYLKNALMLDRVAATQLPERD